MTYKLLGPTAVYLGGKTKELTERAVSNIERIFLNAKEKLGDKIEQPGEVPPRVLRGTVNEGAFCEDKLAAEYLGGVLASSRGEGRRDDRGVVMNAMISRLSVYQLRTHYIFYHIIKDLYDGTDSLVSGPPRNISTSMPIPAYLIAMGFHSNELKDIVGTNEAEGDEQWELISGIVEHTFHGLRKEGLIDGFEYGGGRDSARVVPSSLGIELFLWAHGKGTIPSHRFLDPAMHFEIDKDVILIPGYEPLRLDERTVIGGYTYAEGIGQRCPLKPKPAAPETAHSTTPANLATSGRSNPPAT